MSTTTRADDAESQNQQTLELGTGKRDPGKRNETSCKSIGQDKASKDHDQGGSGLSARVVGQGHGP